MANSWMEEVDELSMFNTMHLAVTLLFDGCQMHVAHDGSNAIHFF